jgi:8-oxo-dGTP pyrophosphatase MutT (NUDIX family)
MSSDRKQKPGSKAAAPKSAPSESRSRAAPRLEGTSHGGPQGTSKGGKGGSAAKRKGGSQATPRSTSAAKPKRGSGAKQGSRSKSEAGAARRPASKTGRRRRAPAREISAGGVVVRGAEVVVIVPTRRASDGSRVLGLPKGHVDPGETPVEAAEREVREETGIIAEVVRELGEARYWYRRNGRTIGKSVSFYLFKHLGGDTADHDDEVEEVRWIGLKEAQTALTHEAEREMVGLALSSLEEGAPKDR